MSKIKTFLTQLHLHLLVLVVAVVAIAKHLGTKVRNLVHTAKVSPTGVAVTAKVEAEKTAVDSNPKVAQAETRLTTLANWVKAQAESHRKLIVVGLGALAVLVILVHRHAPAHVTPVTGNVRVSELTPEGQVFLATTVPVSAVVSATDAGITWHPIPGVTETWHGSYRISK